MSDLQETLSNRDTAVQLRRQAVCDGDIQERHEDWR